MANLSPSWMSRSQVGVQIPSPAAFGAWAEGLRDSVSVVISIKGWNRLASPSVGKYQPRAKRSS